MLQRTDDQATRAPIEIGNADAIRESTIKARARLAELDKQKAAKAKADKKKGPREETLAQRKEREGARDFCVC